MKPANNAWRELRALDKKGKLDTKSPANTLLAMREHPALKGSIAWNEMLCDIELARDIPGVGKAGELMDLSRRQLLTVFLEQAEGLQPSYRLLDNTLLVVARENPTNELKRRLLSLEWDQKPRLKTWLADNMGCAGSLQRIEAAGSRMLLSAVARILEPGCGVDACWMLQAVNNEFVHEALEILFGPYYNRWTDPQLFWGSTVQETRGKWCLNLLNAEDWPASLGSRTKSIARRTHDQAPNPINRYVSNIGRTCIYVAVVPRFPDQTWLKTVNGSDHFFECVAIRGIANLERDRNQLLAEAVRAYKFKRSWLREAWTKPERLTKEQEKALKFVTGKSDVSIRELTEGLGKVYDPTNRRANMISGMLLRKLGLRKFNASPLAGQLVVRYRWPQ